MAVEGVKNMKRRRPMASLLNQNTARLVHGSRGRRRYGVWARGRRREGPAPPPLAGTASFQHPLKATRRRGGGRVRSGGRQREARGEEKGNGGGRWASPRANTTHRRWRAIMGALAACAGPGGPRRRRQEWRHGTGDEEDGRENTSWARRKVWQSGADVRTAAPAGPARFSPAARGTPAPRGPARALPAAAQCRAAPPRSSPAPAPARTPSASPPYPSSPSAAEPAAAAAAAAPPPRCCAGTPRSLEDEEAAPPGRGAAPPPPLLLGAPPGCRLSRAGGKSSSPPPPACAPPTWPGGSGRHSASTIACVS
ncbi:unnamed protein product [Prorocentrum cordatum]|uniref:Uncharacterized protein n=1 Tax=Prorocentrum cordatum TaxID=2364126 RepID=A0ABN9U3N6_9DINO|nr:unnamed protein product [Polarella glacialis]